MSGRVLTIPAQRRTGNADQVTTNGWLVEFHLRTQYEQRNVILVRVFNYRGRRKYDVYQVSRVQFVPIPSVDNEFYLRLYRLSIRGEEEVVKNDPNNVAPLLLGSEELSSPLSRWFLRFNTDAILESRNLWRSNVGWQLLRYTNGDSFFWQGRLVADEPVEAQPLEVYPQPLDPQLLESRQPHEFSIVALREVAFRTEWRVRFSLQSVYRPEFVRVTIFNFNNQSVLDLFFVSCVQFVPAPNEDNRFYLRLYTHHPFSDGESVVENDPARNTLPILLGAARVSEWAFLRFNTTAVEASRDSWTTNFRWDLLRYTQGNAMRSAVGNTFVWQARLEPDEHVEPQPHIPADAEYDVAELLPNEEISSWVCSICHENIAENGMLVCAHEPGSDRALHVFHKNCLESWMSSKNTCPMCRQQLDPKPLPAVLSAGNFTLAARMGVNPYIVFKVSCVSCV
jgi:hypothetical protein